MRRYVLSPASPVMKVIAASCDSGIPLLELAEMIYDSEDCGEPLEIEIHELEGQDGFFRRGTDRGEA